MVLEIEACLVYLGYFRVMDGKSVVAAGMSRSDAELFARAKEDAFGEVVSKFECPIHGIVPCWHNLIKKPGEPGVRVYKCQSCEVANVERANRPRNEDQAGKPFGLSALRQIEVCRGRIIVKSVTGDSTITMSQKRDSAEFDFAPLVDVDDVKPDTVIGE